MPCNSNVSVWGSGEVGFQKETGFKNPKNDTEALV